MTKTAEDTACPEAPRRYRTATELVHGGTLRSSFNETSEALFMTQGFVYPSAEAAEARFKGEDPGFIYSRFSNPTTAMFEARMAALEGAEEARAVASGMAAVTSALLCFLKAGDHVVAPRAMFGSCVWVIETLLPRLGIEATLIDGRDLAAWRAAVRPQTRAFFFETPTNPTLEVIDIAGVVAIAKESGITVIVDNVFATPLWQSPLTLGADVVVYSATKHIDGQGRCLGGVILSSKQWIADNLHNFLRQTGPCISPFNAWVLLKALETFQLRVERQSANAARLADHLAGRPGLARVVYCGRPDHPQAALVARQMKGGSSLIAIEVEGGKAAAFTFCNALRLIRISNNLGDAKSLITHPQTTTHQSLPAEARAALGIGDGLLRLSVGLEDVEDLIEDVDAGLAAVAALAAG